MANKNPRTSPTARVISNRLPDQGAQIVVDESIAIATQTGSGIILDDSVIEIQSDKIKLSANEFVEIQGASLNTELVTAIMNSKEVADLSRMNRFAGEMIPGDIKHAHLYPSIYVPSTYKSQILNQIRQAGEIIASLADIASAILGDEITDKISNIAGSEINDKIDEFADSNSITGRSDEFGPLNSLDPDAPMVAL